MYGMFQLCVYVPEPPYSLSDADQGGDLLLQQFLQLDQRISQLQNGAHVMTMPESWTATF